MLVRPKCAERDDVRRGEGEGGAHGKGRGRFDTPPAFGDAAG